MQALGLTMEALVTGLGHFLLPWACERAGYLKVIVAGNNRGRVLLQQAGWQWSCASSGMGNGEGSCILGMSFMGNASHAAGASALPWRGIAAAGWGRGREGKAVRSRS